jgi:hypothetical protein
LLLAAACGADPRSQIPDPSKQQKQKQKFWQKGNKQKKEKSQKRLPSPAPHFGTIP